MPRPEASRSHTTRVFARGAGQSQAPAIGQWRADFAGGGGNPEQDIFHHPRRRTRRGESVLMPRSSASPAPNPVRCFTEAVERVPKAGREATKSRASQTTPQALSPYVELRKGVRASLPAASQLIRFTELAGFKIQMVRLEIVNVSSADAPSERHALAFTSPNVAHVGIRLPPTVSFNSLRGSS